MVVKGDASAALGIIGRRGLGKVRHVDTAHLWIQEVSAKRRAEYKKVEGSVNPADLLTKALPARIALEHMETLNSKPAAGRSQIAASADLSACSAERGCGVSRDDKCSASKVQPQAGCCLLQPQEVTRNPGGTKVVKIAKETTGIDDELPAVTAVPGGGATCRRRDVSVVSIDSLRST